MLTIICNNINKFLTVCRNLVSSSNSAEDIVSVGEQKQVPHDRPDEHKRDGRDRPDAFGETESEGQTLCGGKSEADVEPKRQSGGGNQTGICAERGEGMTGQKRVQRSGATATGADLGCTLRIAAVVAHQPLIGAVIG